MYTGLIVAGRRSMATRRQLPASSSGPFVFRRRSGRWPRWDLLCPSQMPSPGIARGVDVYLFLIGMMLIAELAQREGLFDYLAAFAVEHARGSPQRLFLLVYVVGMLATVFPSNDANTIELTPAVYAATRAAGASPLPYLFVCAFIANVASFVLPISNLANLVVYGARMSTTATLATSLRCRMKSPRASPRLSSRHWLPPSKSACCANRRNDLTRGKPSARPLALPQIPTGGEQNRAGLLQPSHRARSEFRCRPLRICAGSPVGYLAFLSCPFLEVQGTARKEVVREQAYKRLQRSK